LVHPMRSTRLKGLPGKTFFPDSGYKILFPKELQPECGCKILL
jgi:hypothetical protein